MAGEEDVELRELVAQTLETKGVLGKIRAQLRASVFLALEEQEFKEKAHPLLNERLKEFLTTKEGHLTASLVREFLEFFQLEFTSAVFDPETNLSDYPGRETLASSVGLDTEKKVPLLTLLLQKGDRAKPPPLPSSNTAGYAPNQLFPTVSTQASVPPPSVTTATRTTDSSVAAAVTTLTTAASTSAPAAAAAAVTGSSKLPPYLVANSDGLNKSGTELDSKLADMHLKEGQWREPGSKPILDLEPSSHEAFAELGETFANSALNDDKLLLNSSDELDRILKSHDKERSGLQRDGDSEGSGGMASLGNLPPLSLGKAQPFHTTASQDGRGDKLTGGGGGGAGRGEGGGLGLGLQYPFGNDRSLRQIGVSAASDGGVHDYDDDFTSDAAISEHLEGSSKAVGPTSGKYETADISLSENSLAGEFDYTESIT